LEENTDDFALDNEMLAQAQYFDFRVGEISCPARYFAEASSINFRRSVIYGLGVVAVLFKYRLQKSGVAKLHKGKRLLGNYSEMVCERSRA
jgi:hypothetical protein